MKLINTLIVDDEERGRTVIKELIHRYCPQVNLLAECDSTATAKAAISIHKPQLVFLDISMPKENAFEMLQTLGEINFEIIFITAHLHYSIQAFKYSAVDYLLKPVSEDLLVEAVRRVQERLHEKQLNQRIETLLHNFSSDSKIFGKRICIHGVKGFQVISLKDILYLEAESCYTIFHLNDEKKITSAKTISEYEEIIDDISFIRVHKSFVININYIKEYIKGDGGYVLLSNGQHIEVSRRKKEVFLERIKTLFNQ